jgi:hypothetical protein
MANGTFGSTAAPTAPPWASSESVVLDSCSPGFAGNFPSPRFAHATVHITATYKLNVSTLCIIIKTLSRLNTELQIYSTL